MYASPQRTMACSGTHYEAVDLIRAVGDIAGWSNVRIQSDGLLGISISALFCISILPWPGDSLGGD